VARLVRPLSAGTVSRRQATQLRCTNTGPGYGVLGRALLDLQAAADRVLNAGSKRARSRPLSNRIFRRSPFDLSVRWNSRFSKFFLLCSPSDCRGAGEAVGHFQADQRCQGKRPSSCSGCLDILEWDSAGLVDSHVYKFCCLVYANQINTSNVSDFHVPPSLCNQKVAGWICMICNIWFQFWGPIQCDFFSFFHELLLDTTLTCPVMINVIIYHASMCVRVPHVIMNRLSNPDSSANLVVHFESPV
jgi:hypothetical protein